MAFNVAVRLERSWRLAAVEIELEDLEIALVTQPSPGLIGRRAALGGILMVGARLITRLFDLATMLVLARILLPVDFGLVAIAMTSVSILEAALELPVNQALLRLPAITMPQYDTAFTLSAMRGLVLTSILLLIAFPFAHFYGDDRLAPLVCVLSIAPVARGMTSPRLAEYQKNMNFWRDFAIELAGKLVGFLVGVGIALWTGSYWSIAAGTVAYPLAMATASYGLAPYKPRLSLSESRVFLDFIGWMSAAQIVGALNWQFERLFLGKLQTASQLGLFTTASDVANIPLLALFGPILRPLLAAFAHFRHQREQLARSYQTASSAILAVGVPILVGECLVAEPLVLLLLGEKWRDAVHLLRWLAVSLIPGLFAVAANPLMMSFGKTNLVLKRNIIEVCVKLPIVLVGGIEFGFAGIILARFVSESVSALFSTFVVRDLIGIPIRDQLLVSWRAIISTIAMVVPVMLCIQYFPAGGGTLKIAERLAVTTGLGAATYAAVLWGIWSVSGRPAGVESMMVGALGKVTATRRRRNRPPHRFDESDP